jgi:hypothetical protein
MADYILLRNSDDHILEEAASTRFRRTGTPPVLNPEKGIRWLKLVVVNPSQTPNQIKEGPVVDITSTTYTRTWTVRDKTVDELDGEDTSLIEGLFENIEPLLLALNDGSFVPGSEYTVSQMKTILKGKL